jgi:hypothetical protein
MVDADTVTGRRRPSHVADRRRDKRVVTFVTGAEHAQLEQLSLKEVRSLWFIVHRMIATQLKKDETICDKARLRQPHGLPND